MLLGLYLRFWDLTCFIHCVLHRHALASKAAKSLPEQLKNVLSIVVSAVNFIRGQALNHRFFKVFCDEIGAERNVLLYHTEGRWLSRGRVLTRVFDLHKEIQQFLRLRSSLCPWHTWQIYSATSTSWTPPSRVQGWTWSQSGKRCLPSLINFQPG